jgi:hypothetical protein
MLLARFKIIIQNHWRQALVEVAADVIVVQLAVLFKEVVDVDVVMV